MFCPSCGTESTGLKYCNRCGANLGPLAAPTEIVQVNLTKPAMFIGVVLTFLTLGGFGLLILGARILGSVVRGEDPLIAMIFMGMVIILTVDIILLRQLTKLINAALKPDSTRIVAPSTQVPQVPQLPRSNIAPSFQSPSVTENTTRFLESDYRAPAQPQPVEKRNT